jgi:hypothetical protein
MRAFVFAFAFVVAAMSGGCGLISSDVTNFDLTLPDKTFTVDTQQWMLTNADTFLSTDCSANRGECAAAANQVCKSVTCFGSCDASTNTCDAQVLVSLYQTINLLTDKPELKQINDAPLVNVHIDSIDYVVTENSLNIDTPELQLYVAPATIMAPGDPQASEIGTIAPIPAGTTPPMMTITIGSDGQAALSKFMGDYMNPFNIIVGTTLDLKMGSTIPMGRLTATVKVAAHAQLGG